jgi:hypothetical protein
MVAGLTAAQSVDIFTAINVAQTTGGGLALTLQNPTVATAGRVVIVTNVGTQAFSMYGVTLTTAGTPQTASAQFYWAGAAWVAIQ